MNRNAYHHELLFINMSEPNPSATIEISGENKDILDKLKREGEDYNGLIRRLIIEAQGDDRGIKATQ